MSTDKNIESPEKLYEYFESYKKDCKKNPRVEYVYNHRLDQQGQINREKPLTWNGLDIWLRKNGILSRLDDYKANKDNRYDKYAYIIRMIGVEIYEDKFTGAAVGIFSHNIIARDIGLIDKTEETGSVSINISRSVASSEEDGHQS